MGALKCDTLVHKYNYNQKDLGFFLYEKSAQH